MATPSCELFGHSYHEKTGVCHYCDVVLPPLPPKALVLPPVITVRYSTIDRYSESRRFKTLAGARAYARRKMGDTYDIGGYYAVSGDGVAKLTSNISLGVLLGDDANWTIAH